MLGGALVLGGCGKTVGSSFDPAPPDAGASNVPPAPSSSFGTFGAGGSGATYPREAEPSECELDASATVFGGERRFNARPAASVFYSWTTAEQVAEIKSTKAIFTRTERPGLGPGHAMDLFASLASDKGDTGQLAALLAGNTFSKARYAWTAAWATRMGWPDESYGDQLLRIELRPEAWILRFTGGVFTAFDQSNNQVAIDTVRATPERIGAIYFVQNKIYVPCDLDSGAGSPYGHSSFGGTCARGYREYILGSDAMVASYSHGTADIQAEIARGRDLLTRYRARTTWRPSDEPSPWNDGYPWNARVVEGWSSSTSQCSEDEAYRNALAIPSDLYAPTQDKLQAILDTLQNDPFELDPFVITR